MTHPPTPVRTDRNLQEDVVAELKWTPSVNSAHIGVAVDAGVVTLSGIVDTYPQRLLAETAALAVNGIYAVAQELTVRNNTTCNDTDIARAAGEALDRAVDVPADSVKVVVRDHHITLSGNVAWHYQREAADRAVQDVTGVFGVSNAITIRPTVSAVNLQGKITAALARNAQLRGAEITVTTDSGTVTLAGTVHSGADRCQAENISWSAPGVTHVTNRLRILN